MGDPGLIIGIAAAAVVVTVVVGALLWARLFKKVEQGYALVVSTPAAVRVSFTGAPVLPIVHRAEIVDLRVKAVVIERDGRVGLVCRDDIRANVTATFHVRVNNTHEDVRRVSSLVGCERAVDPVTLEELFVAKFAESLKIVFRQYDFEQLADERDRVREQVIEVVGNDLSGYVLDDLALDRIEQTPIDQLDPNNIMDAKGIRKIVETTTRAEIARTEVERELRTKQLELEELVIEHERRKADAFASFAKTTGKELSNEALQASIEERLRALVDPAVAEALDTAQSE